MFHRPKSCLLYATGFNTFRLILYLVIESNEFFLNSLLLRELPVRNN